MTIEAKKLHLIRRLMDIESEAVLDKMEAIVAETLPTESVALQADAYQKARQLFEEVNQIAAETELSEMTMDDIIHEIKDYRREKRERSH
jgi:hypothetical protein